MGKSKVKSQFFFNAALELRSQTLYLFLGADSSNLLTLAQVDTLKLIFKLAMDTPIKGIFRINQQEYKK
jgi:hypothetical protein